MNTTLGVRGMSCSHCVAAITSAVRPLPGVIGVEVNLTDGVVTVSGEVDRHRVAAAIEDCGYDVDAA